MVNINPRKNVNFTKAERKMLEFVDAKANFNDYVKGLIADDMAGDSVAKKRYIARKPAPPTLLVPQRPSLRSRVKLGM